MAAAASATTAATEMRPTGLILGDVFPDFSAETSQGPMESWYKYIGEKNWAILFSHPDDFTPVCTTELLRVSQLADEFEKRNCKLAALSCNDVTSHQAWIKDICSFGGLAKDEIPFPIIADPKRDLAYRFGMLDPVVKDAAGLPMTCRAVFVIGPERTLKLSILYPASTGRNFDEILRVLDSLQLTVNHKCATPADWQAGKECMVLPSLTDDDAKKVLPKGFRKVQLPSSKGYLRFTPDPR